MDRLANVQTIVKPDSNRASLYSTVMDAEVVRMKAHRRLRQRPRGGGGGPIETMWNWRNHTDRLWQGRWAGGGGWTTIEKTLDTWIIRYVESKRQTNTN